MGQSLNTTAVNNSLYSTQGYVTLTRVHKTAELTESVRSNTTYSLLSEDQIVQIAYDKLTSDIEKTLYREFKFEVHKKLAIKVMKELQQNSNVEYIQQDILNVIYDTLDDPYFTNGSLWGLTSTNCDDAWDITKGNNVIVAIVDSGVDNNHPDLQNNLWQNSHGTWGYDFSDEDWYPSPDGSHGTHVAGTVAAVGNNGRGVIGVAPEVTIMALKIFPNAYSSVCADAIRYAVDNGAKVLNNSWGPRDRHPSDPTIENAIEYAHSKGAVVVFAAGNSNDDAGYYHGGNSPYTVCVAAVDSSFRRASFSNYGSVVDIAAPGVSIQSTVPNNSYSSMSGTSMAAPHIAGLAALIIARNPGFTYDQVLQRMKDTVIPISATNIGAGVMNAYAAVQGGSGDTQAPTIPSYLSASNITSSTATLTWGASTDNVGVTGYKIYADGTYIKTIIGTTCPLSNMSANTSYLIEISAIDAAGNESGKNSITLTTTGGGGDTQAPTTPTNLNLGGITSSSITLNWDASTDNVSVTGYRIYVNGSYSKTVINLSSLISDLTSNTTYQLSVSAIDAAGNESDLEVISGTTIDSGNAAWQTWTYYSIGTVVIHNGNTYSCRQSHTSLPGWEPHIVPALWLIQ